MYQVRAVNEQSKTVYRVIDTPDGTLANDMVEHCNRGSTREEWSFSSYGYVTPGLPDFQQEWLGGEAPREWPNE